MLVSRLQTADVMRGSIAELPLKEALGGSGVDLGCL